MSSPQPTVETAAAASLKKKTFPQKLWVLVNDSRLDPAIRWSPDGRSFFVFENQLKNMCLGKENKNFFTKEPKSFIRQLHLYGFRKLAKNQFRHPNFLREKPSLVKDIKRSYRNHESAQQNYEVTPQEVITNQSTPISTPILRMATGYDSMTFDKDALMTHASSICSLCICPGCYPV